MLLDKMLLSIYLKRNQKQSQVYYIAKISTVKQPKKEIYEDARIDK